MKTRKEASTRINEMKTAMGLSDWEIDVASVEPPNEQALASIHTSYGQRRAVVYLSNELFDQTKKQQTHALTHELVHCHLSNLADAIANVIALTGQEVQTLATQSIRDEIERATDAIATAWAASL